jgi:hypothetical protein
MPDNQPQLPDFTPLVTSIVAMGTTAMGQALDKAASLDPGAQENFTNILSQVDTFMTGMTARIEALLNKVKEVYTAAPQLPQTPVPVSVVDVLGQISLAIKNAETVLNKQNFVIVDGKVETEVQVKLKNGPGASAKITFEIKPKPHA